MSQKHQEKNTQDSKNKDVEPASTDTPTTVTATNVDEEALDDLLDEIDNVLEENAEQFVADYVQKGGE